MLSRWCSLFEIFLPEPSAWTLNWPDPQTKSWNYQFKPVKSYKFPFLAFSFYFIDYHWKTMIIDALTKCLASQAAPLNAFQRQIVNFMSFVSSVLCKLFDARRKCFHINVSPSWLWMLLYTRLGMHTQWRRPSWLLASQSGPRPMRAETQGYHI